MKPLIVELITLAPTEFRHCSGCEAVLQDADIEGMHRARENARETSLPPEMMREYEALCRWISDVGKRYQGRVKFRLIDAATLEGIVKSARYGVRRYPAMILNGKGVVIGGDLEKGESLIRQMMAEQPA